jgi:hypothetical protein
MMHEIFWGVEQARQKGVRSDQYHRLVFSSSVDVECTVKQPAMCAPEGYSVRY